MKEATISVKNLQKNFHGKNGKVVEAVKNISFDIYKEEFVAFIGPNGAGKTTTLKCLSGLLVQDSGEVEVLGFKPQKRDYAFLRDISLVMGQKSQLWWELPPKDTFLLNKEIYQVSDTKYSEVVDEMVEVLNIGEVINTPTRNLSLGERMKCELVASLIHTPKLVFLDEPTIGLDVVSQQKLRDFLKEYNKRYKATILVTSHNMEDIVDLCKRVILIDKGSVIYDGKISDLVNRYVKRREIHFVLKDPVSPKELESLGKLTDYSGGAGILSVPRDMLSSVVQRLLNENSVVDLDVHEPRLEDVIKEIFSEGYKV